MLIKDYYTIEGREKAEGKAFFHIRLNPDCPIYQGHFPGEPVSPGVCNIQLLKELAEEVAGCELMMNHLNLCRLTTLVTPLTHPTMVATLVLEESSDGYKLHATLGKGEEIYLEMKGEMKVKS